MLHRILATLGLPGFWLGLVAISLAGTSRERPLLISHSNDAVFVVQCTPKESLPPAGNDGTFQG